MLGNILNPNNPFFRTTGKVVDIVLLSLIWLVVSLPVVTIGPATAGLYYACAKCVRGGEAEPYRNFFRVFRENFKVGAIASMIVAAAAFLLFCGYLWLYLVATAGGTGYMFFIAYLVVVFLLAGVASYLFPVLSRFTLGVGGLFSNTVKLAASRLPSTIAVAAITVAGMLVCVHYWLPVVFVPATVALLHSLLLERAFKPFMGEETGE